MHLLRTLAASLALRTVGATASHLLIATIYAVSWANPRHELVPTPTDLSQLLWFEFLFIHSGALIIFSRSMPPWIRWGLPLFYLAFGLGLATAMTTPWILLPFGWHLASLMWGDLDPLERGGPFWYRYAGTVLIFLFATMLVSWLPWPSFGWATVTGRYLPDNPGRLIPPLGVLYFGGRTAFEIWMRRATRTGALDRLTRWLKTH